jgi:hypothetical protein
MISLHSYLVYTYEQQIFIDKIQVYSRRHKGQDEFFHVAIYGELEKPKCPVISRNTLVKAEMKLILSCIHGGLI